MDDDMEANRDHLVTDARPKLDFMQCIYFVKYSYISCEQVSQIMHCMHFMYSNTYKSLQKLYMLSQLRLWYA